MKTKYQVLLKKWGLSQFHANVGKAVARLTALEAVHLRKWWYLFFRLSRVLLLLGVHWPFTSRMLKRGCDIQGYIIPGASWFRQASGILHTIIFFNTVTLFRLPKRVPKCAKWGEWGTQHPDSFCTNFFQENMHQVKVCGHGSLPPHGKSSGAPWIYRACGQTCAGAGFYEFAFHVWSRTLFSSTKYRLSIHLCLSRWQLFIVLAILTNPCCRMRMSTSLP